MTDREKKELSVTEKQAVDAREGELTREGPTYVPHVDIIEEPNAITLRADLPGVKKGDVDIDVRENILTLHAAIDLLPENWSPVYTEYPIGAFARRFSLSEKIDQEKITAALEDGVLTLVLPKAEAHKPRRIEIG